MAPKPDRSAERRTQILDAAENVFAQMGFNQATMDDIVVESGLSKGALYWYYKSKDALILALLDRIFAGGLAHFEGLVDVDGSASERLDVIIQGTVQEMIRIKHLMPLIYEFVALAARRKSVRETLGGYYRHYHDIISRIIEQGIDSGEFVDIDPDEAALAFLGLGEGLAMLYFVDPQWMELENIGATLKKYIVSGFETSEG
jgi:AcrR family transcriptional regulator